MPEAELMKKLQAKMGDAKFIQLLRDNSWKSRGRNTVSYTTLTLPTQA